MFQLRLWIHESLWNCRSKSNNWVPTSSQAVAWIFWSKSVFHLPYIDEWFSSPLNHKMWVNWQKLFAIWDFWRSGKLFNFLNVDSKSDFKEFVVSITLLFYFTIACGDSTKLLVQTFRTLCGEKPGLGSRLSWRSSNCWGFCKDPYIYE